MYLHKISERKPTYLEQLALFLLISCKTFLTYQTATFELLLAGTNSNIKAGLEHYGTHYYSQE
jgi:hypothetical protein